MTIWRGINLWCEDWLKQEEGILKIKEMSLAVQADMTHNMVREKETMASTWNNNIKGIDFCKKVIKY